MPRPPQLSSAYVFQDAQDASLVTESKTPSNIEKKLMSGTHTAPLDLVKGSNHQQDLRAQNPEPHSRHLRTPDAESPRSRRGSLSRGESIGRNDLLSRAGSDRFEFFKIHDDSKAHKHVQYCSLTVGLIAFVATFCAFQVLLTVVGSTSLDFFILGRNSENLNTTLHNVTTELGQLHFNQTRDLAKHKIEVQIKEVSFCATLLANNFRTGEISLSEKQALVRALFLNSVFFDLHATYFGTRDNEYAYVRRINNKNSAIRPDFTLRTNFFNGPNHDTPLPTTLLQSFEVKSNGDPINTTAEIISQTFKAREEPFYQTSRHTQEPTWTEPVYNLEEGHDEGVLTIGACVPVYDNSGLPKYDPEAPATGSWATHESLEVVSCCDSTVDGLSSILSHIGIGEKGVAFIVEGGGDWVNEEAMQNAGKLVAAAVHNTTLPVVELVERDDLNTGSGVVTYKTANRFSALEYPEKVPEGHLIRQIAEKVIGRTERRLWRDVGDWTFHEEWDGLDNRYIGVQTVVLKGKNPGWMIDGDGDWSEKAYTLKNLHWVLVIGTMLETAGESVDDAVLRSQDISQDSLIANLRNGAILIVCSFFISYMTARHVHYNLNRLSEKFHDLETLKFTDNRGLKSELYEVARMYEAFEHMSNCLLEMSKYVPASVIKLMTADQESADVAPARLGMDKVMCTIVCSTIANFDQISRKLSNEELVELMDLYFAIFTTVIEQAGGTLSDFGGRNCVAFFPQTTGEHERIACRAVCDIVEALEKRKSRFAKHFEYHFAVHTGVVWVGNYGTSERMKYGAVGENVEVCARLVNMGHTFDSIAIISTTTAQRASEFVGEFYGSITLRGKGTENNKEPDGPSSPKGRRTSEMATSPLAKYGDDMKLHLQQARSILTRKTSLRRTGSVAEAGQEVRFFELDVSQTGASRKGSNHEVNQMLQHAESNAHIRVFRTGSDSTNASFELSKEQSESFISRNSKEVQTSYWASLREKMSSVSFLLVAFCSVQIILASVILYWQDVKSLEDSSLLLNTTLSFVINNISFAQQDKMVGRCVEKIVNHIIDIPKCGELLANQFRTGDLLLDRPSHIAKTLQSFVIFFDVSYAYISTKDDKYFAANRQNDPDPYLLPDFFHESNFYNLNDTSMVQYHLLEDRDVDLSTARVLVENYKPTHRPFYTAIETEPHDASVPTWAPPFLWIGSVRQLGIDACIPVFGNQEAMQLVACCDRTLDGLSKILVKLGLGEHGVAFIVEASGVNEGKLIAAAQHNFTLKISPEPGQVHVDSNGWKASPEIERYSAVGYEGSAVGYEGSERGHGELLRYVADQIMRDKRSWSEVNETENIGKPDTMDWTGVVNHILVKTKKIDGTVPHWMVDKRGGWSPAQYTVAGMDWLLVIAQDPDDFIEVQGAIDENKAVQAQSNRLRVALSVVILIGALLVCLFFARMGTIQLRRLTDQMDRVRKMQLDEVQLSLSNIREIYELQISFNRMRGCLAGLQKYVSVAVIDRIAKDSKAGELRTTPQPSLSNKTCTLVCCKIANFAQISDSISRKNVLIIMDQYLARAKDVTYRLDGIFNDFSGDMVTMFWTHSSRDKDPEDALRACEAALDMLAAVNELNSIWSRFGIKESINLKLTIGIATMPCLVGDYGTGDRLKYGVVGDILTHAEGLAFLAKSYNCTVVLNEDSKDAVHGSFKCQYLATGESGLIYQLIGTAKSMIPRLRNGDTVLSVSCASLLGMMGAGSLSG